MKQHLKNLSVANFSLSALFFLSNLSVCYSQQKNKAIKSKELVDLVYPQLDTDNSRWFFFSSASRPFGMVNLSPDTEIKGDWGAGYKYNLDTIKGFSHIHEWQLSGLSIMPVALSAANQQNIFTDFYSKFSHKTEIVHPGYHQVQLDRFKIKAELTSSARVGFSRFTFLDKDAQKAVLLNLNTVLGPCDNFDGKIVNSNDNEIEGSVTLSTNFRRPRPAKVYFHIKFDQQIKSIRRDTKTKNYLVQFDDSTSGVLMKAGLSYTSNANALINLQEELPHWNFDLVVKESRKEWNNLLGRIEVKGNTIDSQRRFYTDLWHALQGRKAISDTNGAYPDNATDTPRIGQIPLGSNGKPLYRQFNSDSFWGAQWTINTLWGLVYPEIAQEFVQSLMQYYKDSGSIPRGPSGGNDTYVMTGAAATPFIVSAIQKGIVKEDLNDIYVALKKAHMPGGMMAKAGYEHDTFKGGGLSYYINNGFVPYPLPDGNFGSHQDGASQTLENAYQDWTLAEFARKLGNVKDAIYFSERALNYKNLFDKETGWIRPKDVLGNWMQPFDPYVYENGFIESNAAQATWFVPHDLDGLAKLMGGNEKAALKLNEQFVEAEKLNFTSGDSHDAELHPEYSRIPVNFGNQPSMQTSFIFNYLNRPDLTQYWTRKVIDKAFSGLDTHTGYNGDEDQGLMGSLNVLLKLGIFQMKGGADKEALYDLGSPIFSNIKIHLNKKFYKGKAISIEAIDNNVENVFVKEFKWNGVVLPAPSLSHEELTKGGTLRFKMTDSPN